MRCGLVLAMASPPVRSDRGWGHRCRTEIGGRPSAGPSLLPQLPAFCAGPSLAHEPPASFCPPQSHARIEARYIDQPPAPPQVAEGLTFREFVELLAHVAQHKYHTVPGMDIAQRMAALLAKINPPH